MSSLTLHSHPQSGHAHRVELLLSLLELSYRRLDLDLAKRANRAPEFLRLNPLGEVPLLMDGERPIAESNAILVYLARRENRTDWLPLNAAGLANVETWLSRAADKLSSGIAKARLITLFGLKGDLQEAQARGVRLLRVAEEQLAAQPYLVGHHPTIADLAIYSYAALAGEAGIDMSKFRQVAVWITRIEGLPKFVPLRRVGEFYAS
ncbi:glutathione S-transferase N-terminal domain-containing protein [Bradyrhizobium sp. SSUT112]|uniref:glutathione S-transferase family protein n=1 Tax=Bradyrhizobium sp. SSUT112 TaxID=3040604 RepID=UPI002449C2CA|nr:glutathione S-transferase N-terminal domain-containing protein [Bradyrhizobium sp. SSUT112]MDH2352232.1 glutathione S-transferase N-terminal domain-containing protein [Bradyrhizobium sp. SSUT112]